MKAIRQFLEVKNNSINVVLPEGFTAKTVEVIILAIVENDNIPEWHKEIVLERIKNSQTPVDAFEMIDELEKEKLENLTKTRKFNVYPNDWNLLKLLFRFLTLEDDLSKWTKYFHLKQYHKHELQDFVNQ